MDCKCGRPTIEGKVTCGRIQCGSSTGNTQTLSEMEAIARAAKVSLPSASEASVRADERAKWARILRQSADTKRRWAVELRSGSAEDREAATQHDREAIEWSNVADLIEDNNEQPCREEAVASKRASARPRPSAQVDAPRVTACFCSKGHQGPPGGHAHWTGYWPADGGRCKGCGTVNDVHLFGCPEVYCLKAILGTNYCCTEPVGHSPPCRTTV
jgi:hypothetical protein